MQTIKDYIRNLRHLPPTPRLVPELMRLLNQPDVDSSRIVSMISYDPALTANILRISNSAYFAASQPTSDLQEAVTRLGFQQVYQLVAAADAAHLLNTTADTGADEGDLWKHSVAAAVAAQRIANRLGENDSLAFTAGLLHDIGKIILTNSLKGTYAKIVKDTDATGNSLLDVETKTFGVNHAELGGQLLQHWKFPPNIVAAVWFHHTPKGAGVHQRLASCIYLANMIACFMGYSHGHVSFASRARAEVMTTLDLPLQAIPELMTETFEQMKVVETLCPVAA
jgi:putative nucleotidyltransferase with HDIG domain